MYDKFLSDYVVFFDIVSNDVLIYLVSKNNFILQIKEQKRRLW